MSDDTIKIPVQACYHIENGVPILKSAEYKEVSATAFARFLVDNLGGPLLKGGENE